MSINYILGHKPNRCALENCKENRRKYTFSPYILILPLLVPKPINACYFRPFRQSIDRNS